MERGSVRRPPPGHALAVAVAASGLGPSGLAVGILPGWLPLHIPPGLQAAGFVVAIVAFGTLPLTIPLAFATLANYRHRVPPSRRRTLWTAVVLALLAPSLGIAGAVAWSLLMG